MHLSIAVESYDEVDGECCQMIDKGDGRWELWVVEVERGVAYTRYYGWSVPPQAE